MTKRVLFWSERFWPTIGGVGLSARTLLPALRERGYEFIVLTLQEYFDLPEEDEYVGIRVCRWPFWTALNSGDVVRLVQLRQRVAALKREFAPDLIHINFLGSTALFHAQTEKVHPAPLLVSMDSAFLEQSGDPDSLAGRMLDSAAWVTSVSVAGLTKMREILPQIIPRSSCIYGGYPIPATEPAPLPMDPPRLLCLGRLDRVKGFDIALRAFATISSRYPDARLTIAGDGPERSELQRQIEELRLTSVVEMLGWVDPERVPELVNRAALVLMPSRHEGLPNVAKEAGLMARPVVATQVGGLPEIIEDGETGLLVKPEDPSVLAEAVISLVDNPERAANMGQRARVRVTEMFDFGKYVGAYDNLYARLISEAHQTRLS